eukprot:1571221-Amphidinium_carterae.1
MLPGLDWTMLKRSPCEPPATINDRTVVTCESTLLRQHAQVPARCPVRPRDHSHAHQHFLGGSQQHILEHCMHAQDVLGHINSLRQKGVDANLISGILHCALLLYTNQHFLADVRGDLSIPLSRTVVNSMLTDLLAVIG